jgi:urease accessory protein
MPARRTLMATDRSARGGLYKLLAWTSPSFPIGAFSYSHGLEAAVAAGTVHDRASLEAWTCAMVRHGSGRIDADLLRDAYRAAAARDAAAIATVNRRGAAYRATAELALESAQQGAAFVAAYDAAWRALAGPKLSDLEPSPLMGEGLGGGGAAASPKGEKSPPPQPSPIKGEGVDGGNTTVVATGDDGKVCHAAAFGGAAAGAGIALADALLGYLQAFAGNLVSAGMRLGVIGQTDGQRILAALKPIVARAVEAANARDPEDFGSATFAADLASMAHETQYSRLFRS